jgi:hypothetical protein
MAVLALMGINAMIRHAWAFVTALEACYAKIVRFRARPCAGIEKRMAGVQAAHFGLPACKPGSIG